MGSELMVESERRLDMECPYCGFDNSPASMRCERCSRVIQPESRDSAVPGTYTFRGPFLVCAVCARPNAHGTTECVACQAPFDVGTPEPARATAELPPQARSRAAASPSGSSERLARSGRSARSGVAWMKVLGPLAVVVRVLTLVLLLWGVWDTGSWLNSVTRGMRVDDVSAIRYNVFAIYELLRNLTLGSAVWLLTGFMPVRSARGN